MKSLAIEREFGSGGREIGTCIAKRADLPYYDSNLLFHAAEGQGLPVGKLQDYDEKWTGSLLYNIAMLTNYTQGADQNSIYEIYHSIQQTILKIEMNGPAVFIGRCATEILKCRPQVVRAYIYSSDEQQKIRRIMDKENLSETEAKRLMEKTDRNRKNYFKFWTQKEWADRKNYDIELNTGKLSIDECADILLRNMDEV